MYPLSYFRVYVENQYRRISLSWWEIPGSSHAPCRMIRELWFNFHQREETFLLSKISRLTLGPTQKILPQWQSDQSIQLTAHLHSVLRSRMTGAKPLCCTYSFTASTRKVFLFFFSFVAWNKGQFAKEHTLSTLSTHLPQILLTFYMDE